MISTLLMGVPLLFGVVHFTSTCVSCSVASAVTPVGAWGGPFGTAFTVADVLVPAAFVTRTAMP